MSIAQLAAQHGSSLLDLKDTTDGSPLLGCNSEQTTVHVRWERNARGVLHVTVEAAANLPRVRNSPDQMRLRAFAVQFVPEMRAD